MQGHRADAQRGMQGPARAQGNRHKSNTFTYTHTHWRAHASSRKHVSVHSDICNTHAITSGRTQVLYANTSTCASLQPLAAKHMHTQAYSLNHMLSLIHI
eukprot:8209773-Alexandrium_andersonii.AAC.1